MPDLSALGHIIEGVVEHNSFNERYQIVSVDSSGKAVVTDLQDLLAAYVGKEVRLTLASFENLAELAAILEASPRG
jgi:hypothetical protein